MSEANTGSGQKLKVFISYSRRDLEFADQLTAILEWQGVQVIIDRKGIHGAENWEQRLGQLILEADTVVFVLSPDSAASDVCKWEAEEASRRAKRIVPVLCRSLEAAQPHDLLRDLNYIHCCTEKDMPGSGFGTGIVRLTAALKQDVSWLREHTRLEELAARWLASGRATDLLVRGSELAGYQSWRDRRPAEAPDLTSLQRAFLGASEAQETARASAERQRFDEMAAAQAQRQKALDDAQAALKRESEAQAAHMRASRIIRWGGAALAMVLVATAIGFAVVQQRLTAIAEKERAEAQYQAKIAQANFEEGQITESHFRAEQAKLTRFDHVTAMLLALEGLPDKAADVVRPFVREPWTALYGAALKQRELAVLSAHMGRVSSAAFSADGKRIVTASDDNTARLWDGDGKPLATLHGHTNEVSSAAFSADGKRIVTSSSDKSARLWDGDGKPLATLEGHTDRVSGVAFSADGKRIVTASSDNTARLWDGDGKPLAELEGHTSLVRSAAFSADGKRIVTASIDNTARLWDGDGKPLATLEGHTDTVNSAAFSADGKRIVTASDDNTARLWDGDGKPLATFEGHTDTVNSAAFSADGVSIVTASSDGAARLWPAFPNPQDLVNVAKVRAPRCLTPKQRADLFLPPDPPAWCKTIGKWPYDAATLAAEAVKARK